MNFFTTFLTLLATFHSSASAHPSPPGKCGSVRNCYLLTINTGEKVDLFAVKEGEVDVEQPENHHTIVCYTRGKIDKVTFRYNDVVHEEYESPWAMGGNSKKVMNNVPYLIEPGQKSITVIGETWTEECFRHTFEFVHLAMGSLEEPVTGVVAGSNDGLRRLASCCGDTCCCSRF